MISFAIGFYLGGAVVEMATDHFSDVHDSFTGAVVSGIIWPYTLVSAFIKTR